MDVRFGKIRATGESYANPQSHHFEYNEDNFFNAFQRHQNQQKNENQEEKNKNVIPLRLNDLDSNIMQNKAYNEIPDELFKLEQKITTLENSLAKITNDITTLEGLGYDIQLYDLKERKNKLEQELKNLNEEYANKSIGAKISNGITSAVNYASRKKTFIQNFKDFVSKNIIAKISKDFYYLMSMKEALSSLGSINSSVDELIRMQVPYGENISRYEKLTAYLNKANSIHSKISSNMNLFSKK